MKELLIINFIITLFRVGFASYEASKNNYEKANYDMNWAIYSLIICIYLLLKLNVI